MDKDSPQRKNRGDDSNRHGEPRENPGPTRLPDHAADLINRALFEEWLQRYGSWDKFIDAARRKELGKDSEPDSNPPEKH